ncbi:acetyl-CoA C-acetyltransferase [Sphingosinicella microcystinivorans]|uniref:acetyl-CoA C-acetyltransferase n=1 Tax=Sphingosinicella microcystinivorans TaxID=335406 RepID=UPI0022F40131|nr:acetyl-CoA C-acetyltransferase [Sphingosinicella microcystinivorans]WBX85801.1 acetyl-CoA C-acetyltransferase [Sphingosinicella microcystinivorans]
MEAYIVAAVRTAGGRRGGALAGWHPADMGGEILNALVDRSGIDPAAIEDVIAGCVTQAGEQSFALARNLVMASKLPDSVPATTVDRQCGSSQQAIHFAAQAVMSGTQDIVAAVGVESMTRVPMGSNFRLHAEAGLGVGPWSPKIKARYGVEEFNQFTGAEMIAVKYGFSRDDLDAFALESHRRGAAATEAGAFDSEILPLPVETPMGPAIHARDEGIRYDASAESIGSVKGLCEGGRLSAATSSQICDGAAGILIANERGLKAHGLTPLARVHNLTVTAGDPVIMLEEPIPATRRALARSGLGIDEIDLYEVNEAFASIPLAWLQATSADPARLNIRGGAIALGHPLGASGAKLMTTLVYALRAARGRYGLQTMCEGGGTANVTIVEAF